MSEGYIYIFTNSCLKKGIMIGYTKDWKAELKAVNESSILVADYKPYLIYKTDSVLSETGNPDSVFETLFQGLKMYENIYDIRKRKAKELIISIAQISGEKDLISDQEENEAEIERGNNFSIDFSFNYSSASYEKDEDTNQDEQIETETEIESELQDETENNAVDNNNVSDQFIGLDKFCEEVNIEAADGFEPTECHFLNRTSLVSSMQDIIEFVLLILYDEAQEKFLQACKQPALTNYLRLYKPNISNFIKAPLCDFYYLSKMFKREMYYLFDKLTNYIGYEIINNGLLFLDKQNGISNNYESENNKNPLQNSNQSNENSDDEVKYNRNNYNIEKEYININESINFDSTIACGLVYEGITYSVESGLYSELIDWIIDLFPKIPEEKIENYVNTERRMFKDSKYISKDSLSLSKPHRLGAYRFYIEDDLTPSQAIRFIKYYASQGGIDYSSFEIIVGR